MNQCELKGCFGLADVWQVSKLPQEAQDVVKKYTEEWRLKENKQIAALVGMGMVPWGQPTLVCVLVTQINLNSM